MYIDDVTLSSHVRCTSLKKMVVMMMEPIYHYPRVRMSDAGEFCVMIVSRSFSACNLKLLAPISLSPIHSSVHSFTGMNQFLSTATLAHHLLLKT